MFWLGYLLIVGTVRLCIGMLMCIWWGCVFFAKVVQAIFNSVVALRASREGSGGQSA